jgi:hypothetical protein
MVNDENVTLTRHRNLLLPYYPKENTLPPLIKKYLSEDKSENFPKPLIRPGTYPYSEEDVNVGNPITIPIHIAIPTPVPVTTPLTTPLTTPVTPAEDRLQTTSKLRPIPSFDDVIDLPETYPLYDSDNDTEDRTNMTSTPYHPQGNDNIILSPPCNLSKDTSEDSGYRTRSKSQQEMNFSDSISSRNSLDTTPLLPKQPRTGVIAKLPKFKNFKRMSDIHEKSFNKSDQSVKVPKLHSILIKLSHQIEKPMILSTHQIKH